jgi:hypothetical protein
VSVSMHKTYAPTQPAPIHVLIGQSANGQITGIRLSTERPYPADHFDESHHGTVWTADTPTSNYDTFADKILDLSHASGYADENTTEWVAGERIAGNFHTPTNRERATLRAIEAELIRAGFPNMHTAAVACQRFGLATDDDACGNHFAYQNADGWHFASIFFETSGDWQTELIAPNGASPRRIATAILVRLADYQVIHTADLTPAYRARVAFGLWRTTPHRKNLAHRIHRARTRISISTR